MVAMRALRSAVGALAYSNDGAHIAAGCGGAAVYIMHAHNLSDALSFSLEPPAYGRAASAARGTAAAATAAADAGSAPIGALAFSPDDSLLAVADASGRIDILQVGSSYRRVHTCLAHTAAVLHLDWSADGRYLASACGRCELHFWDMHTSDGFATRVSDPGVLRDVRWATCTCPLGISVQGIYPRMSDGTDITAVHRCVRERASSLYAATPTPPRPHPLSRHHHPTHQVSRRPTTRHVRRVPQGEPLPRAVRPGLGRVPLRRRARRQRRLRALHMRREESHLGGRTRPERDGVEAERPLSGRPASQSGVRQVVRHGARVRIRLRALLV